MSTGQQQHIADTDTHPACYHCGDRCDGRDIAIGDRYFCCNGCKTVYELLAARDLCDYYVIDEARQGKTPFDSGYSHRYDYLDDPTIVEQLLDFSDGATRLATFRIPSMHCSSCIWLIERLSALNNGVVSARVNFPRKEAAITWNNEKVSLREIVILLASIGYEPYISLQDVAEKRKHSSNRKLYYRIGVAGFSFGNIMLLSFPEYLAAEGTMDPVFALVFRYLNVALSLPVFFYSASPFFASAWAGLRHRYLNIDVPISLGILALFGRSIYEIVSATGTGYLDSLTGLIFFMLIGRIFQKKSYDALSFDRDFRSYFPLSVALRADDGEHNVPLTKLKVGDRIVIRNQELVPTDAVMLRGEANIDYSFVTGEADLITKKSGDRIHAGGRQVGQAIELEVIKDIEQSYLTRLWNNDVFTKESHGRLHNMVDRISKHFTAVVLLIAFGAAAYWAFADPDIMYTVFTAVLIVACPCALALSSPFALGSAQRIFGNNDFYTKNTDAVETLARVDTIVFDKTGTLTQTRSGNVRWHGPALGEEVRAQVKSLLRQSTHALSRQVFASLAGDVTSDVEDYREVPGHGIEGRVDGHALMIGSAEWAQRADAAPPDTGSSAVYISRDGAPLGHFTVPNTYREGLQELVAALKPTYDILILSGDSDREATRLRAVFGDDVPMFFQQSPEDKLTFVSRLRAEGRQVLMVGDGLNDAGALKAADVGISISEDINTFSPACDGILAAQRFALFPRLLAFSKSSVRIVLASFAISFAYNLIGLSFAVAGLLSPLVSAILMPVSSVTVVAFTTVTTRFLARRRGLR
ncbi:MAG: heavy metal translocating P-type ATPase metal-binding domain-containing protein [Bacteroidetes bacterium]|nr:heavy metal translocating P-type ATPase metal-binding domain-containing protein [Bacteroidota bacterium]